MLTKKKNLLVVATTLFILIMAAGFAAERSHAGSTKLWLKINKKKNVMTVYKKSGGKWKPFRAMLCTTGGRDGITPSGTFYMGYQRRWLTMISEIGDKTNEQYTSLVDGRTQVYIHSVWYYDKGYDHASQSTRAFNRLGSHGSHGCIRLSTMDAKWVYDHCNPGTKITIYSDKNSGPLGRPKKIYVSTKKRMNWDPTDPLRNNPIFKMHKPVFKFKKSKSVLYGKKYKLKSGITVINPNANQNITYRLKIVKLTRNGKKISTKKFSTKKLGKYKATYYVRDPYMVQNGRKGTKKVFNFTVYDKATVNAKDYTLKQNETNATYGMSAKSCSKSLTKTSSVTITAPDGTKKKMSYANAVKFKFTQLGDYKVTYSVTNPYPKKTVTKTITVKVESVEEVRPQPGESGNGSGTTSEQGAALQSVTPEQKSKEETCAPFDEDKH